MAIKLKTNSDNISLKQSMLKGDKGDPGEPGRTPVKGVDYFTNTDIVNMIDNHDLATKKYVDMAVENVDGGGGGSSNANEFCYAPGIVTEALYHGSNSARIELGDSVSDADFTKAIQQGMLVLNVGSSRSVYIPLTHGLNGISVCEITEDGVCDYIVTESKTSFVVAYGQYVVRLSNNGYAIAPSWNALKKHFRNLYYDNTNSGLAATTLPGAIDEINEKVSAIDLEPYALKSDLNGFLRESALSGYMTEAQTKTFVYNQGYQSAAQVQTAINNSLSAIGVAEDGAY